MTVDAVPGAARLVLAAAAERDFEAQRALRMAAMRGSVQGLGRFDPQPARERLSRAFEPALVRHLLRDGEPVGLVALLPLPADHPDPLVLDHHYIAPQAQRQGVGSWVMAQVLDDADRLAPPLRVTALKLSDANAFYPHNGLERQREHEGNLHHLRPAAGLAHG